MGYYVTLDKCDIHIDAENHEAAYRALCKLNWQNNLKGGGRSPRPDPLPEGPNEYQWFSWMAWDYHEQCKDLEAILAELGFEAITDSDGNITYLTYDSKTGDEEYFFDALAPYIRAESTMDWSGEDGVHWRWYFDGRTMHTLEGRIVYGD